MLTVPVEDLNLARLIHNSRGWKYYSSMLSSDDGDRRRGDPGPCPLWLAHSPLHRFLLPLPVWVAQGKFLDLTRRCLGQRLDELYRFRGLEMCHPIPAEAD